MSDEQYSPAVLKAVRTEITAALAAARVTLDDRHAKIIEGTKTNALNKLMLNERYEADQTVKRLERQLAELAEMEG